MANVPKFGSTNQIPAALQKQLWGKELWAEAQNELYWNKFTSKAEPTLDAMATKAFNNIITEKTDLKKEKGDKINIALMYKLGGTGVTGDNWLKGNEEDLKFYEDAVTVDQIRNAVALAGAMEEQRFAYNLRTSAKAALKTWLVEMMDQRIFDELSKNPSANRRLFGGDATSFATLEATDVFNTSLISRAKRFAKLATPRIRPLIIDGKEYYVCIAHPYQIKSLRADTVWQNAHYYAHERGLNNPIFAGSDSIVDGVVIHEHNSIWARSQGAGTGTASELGSESWESTATGSDLTETVTGIGEVAKARALFLGAQAGLKAIAKEPFWREDTDDFENQVGFAAGLIWGAKKATFNNLDHGVLALDTAIIED